MTLPAVFASGNGMVHFMGIAGAGMISLAELFARSGLSVTGCDLQPDPAARSLSSCGCEIFSGHDPAHVEGASALVVTAAIPSDHPEIQAARELGIPVMKRAEALGEWVNRGQVVAIAGTHGKTTTTAMATEVLAAAGLNPTGLVGGRVVAWESNLRMGGEELFVVEADEFDRSFHHLRPDVAVLTNLEADHLDIYGDLEGVQEAFRIFLEGVTPQGQVVVCGDDHGASRLSPGLGRKARTYGLNPGSQLRGVAVGEGETGARFEVVEGGERQEEITLRVPGVHNIRNALGAAMAARCSGCRVGSDSEGSRCLPGCGAPFRDPGSGGRGDRRG